MGEQLDHDAYSVSTAIWQEFIERMQTLADRFEPSEVSHQRILKRLEQRDWTVYDDVKNVKALYHETVFPRAPSPTTEQSLGMKSCCVVFFCPWPSQHTINSMDFCVEHLGVALMNARRHECTYCLLLNLLLIRDSPIDLAHEQTMYRVIRVPLGDDVTVSIQRFCDKPALQRVPADQRIVIRFWKETVSGLRTRAKRWC